MVKITLRDIIRQVPERWRRQYFKDSDWISTTHNPRETYNKLKALDLEVATPSDIKHIIGNDSWTRLKCHECGDPKTSVVELGEPPDYESHTARICESCLVKAMAKFNRAVI